jgi:hypothetical protein
MKRDTKKMILIGTGIIFFFALFVGLGQMGKEVNQTRLEEHIATETLGPNGYPIREVYISETADGLVCATTLSPHAKHTPSASPGQDYRRGISCDWASYNSRAKQ